MQKKNETKLLITLKDLWRMSAHPGYSGHGYLAHECRHPSRYGAMSDPYAAVKDCDESVVAVANNRGWSRDWLFEFVNSSMGHHCGDAVLSDWRNRYTKIAEAMDAWDNTSLP
jgi:hypothetical protein